MSGKKARKPHRAFTEDDLISLCNHIGLGDSLRSWCAANDRDPGHVVRWILADAERNKAYREARKLQADIHIDQLIELSDTPIPVDDMGRTDSGAVQQLRVRIDTRKWVAAKFYPALYGEKVAVEGNLNLATMKPDEIMGQVVSLLASHGLRVQPAEDGNDDGHSETG